jgi:hypothetical protein
VFGGSVTCFVVDAESKNVVSVAAGPASDFEAAAAAAGAVPVVGLGDDAVWSGGALHVRVGAEDIVVTLFPASGVDDSRAQEVAEAIAAGVVARYQPPPTTTG